jgi:hypothetical protein
MPLQNRVTPFGDIIADPARGLFTGNRGGRIHDADTRTLVRRSASPRWICCLLAFKGRWREVWGQGYTHLFFCDEVTALAAGHRPCAECRRADGRAFQAAVGKGLGLMQAPGLSEIDARLRREGRARPRPVAPAADLPDGCMIAVDGKAFALRHGLALSWSPSGYGPPVPAPRQAVEILTPATAIAALRAGYAPVWHPTALAA